MREKELRLALVCYGGASLAIYMNGISSEVLKLVRASKAYHGVSDRIERAAATFDQAAPKRPYRTDTESLYFELFQALGQKLELRVIVDVVSGASAGGINGIFLARALAHDLDFDPLRTMWLNLADIEELMEEDTIADRTSKLWFYPFIWLFGRRAFGDHAPDQETKRKLFRFVRSRWFQPPFSGTHMLTWMLNACENMGHAESGHTLMPPGHKLDLFVSLTNFFGQPRRIKLHDPKEVLEHQHSVTLNFGFRQAATGTTVSDFGDDNIPGLGFAARATSSFPGAFPPLRFKDLEDRLTARRQAWPARDIFLTKNFPALISDKATLYDMSFIDGGVTNNKPFGAAISAVYERPAHREVDRRIIYVDPLPDDPETLLEGQRHKELPGFFRTILSALAEIPRREPIYEDLRAIDKQNKNARRFEATLQSAEAQVNRLVDKVLNLDREHKVDTAMLASWRERAHEEAHKHTGFSYSSYMQSKTVRMVERIAQLMVEGAAMRGVKLSESDMFEALRQWAERKGMLCPEGGVVDIVPEQGQQHHVRRLRELDVDYRIRRLRFVIMKLNRFMQQDNQGHLVEPVKKIKRQIYTMLESYRTRWAPEHFDEAIFERLVTQPIDDMAITAFLDSIASAMELEDLDYEQDETFALALSVLPQNALRLTLFRAYVGYAFYDVLMLPMSQGADLLEVDEIRVARISPLDCENMQDAHDQQPLLGTQLYNFGAFFSRKARENDYIWGRLHAASRLVDFMLDAAGDDPLPADYDLEGFKKRLFMTILETEEAHMEESKALIKGLKERFSA
ncbi:MULTISPECIES: patatin-like protein [Kordiimonas]|jgi:patatin-related protein|uniref:patatin-like protein n=1 Tax=Kordiimonas TaxID=288021 RepID=UPI00257AC7E9|nr:patatin-like protein [Kordiimonas sp. UBA4487]